MSEITTNPHEPSVLRLEGLDDESLLRVTGLIDSFLHRTADESGKPSIPRDTTIHELLLMMDSDEDYSSVLTEILSA